MEYPDNWVFDFDQETLTVDFETTPYVKYLDKGESSLPILKSINLSFNDYENEIQKLLLNQFQIILSFFNTEVLCNENRYFEFFSHRVVKYIEAEIIYSINFWAFGSLKEFVRHRVNASLLRFLKFLTALQVMVLEKYNYGRDLSHLSEIEPEKDALAEHLEDLLVDYQQLNTLITYFRKAYGDLYSKLQTKSLIDQREINVIGKIFLFCKLFFAVNPRAIWKTLNKSVSEKTESEALMILLKANDRLKNDIYEKIHKYSSIENERKGVEDYILLQFGNTQTFKKVLKEVDRQHKHPLYEEESYRDRRRLAVSYVRTLDDEIQEKKYIPDDKKRNMLKVGLKDAFHRRNNDQNVKEEFLKELEAKKEKEKEKKDLLSLLAGSANSPLKNNKFVPIDARFSETEYQLSKSIKTVDTLTLPGKGTGISSFITDEPRGKKEASSTIGAEDDHHHHQENESALSDLPDITPDSSQDGDLDFFLKETLDEKFLSDMLEQKLEPKKLKSTNEQKVMQAEIKNRNFLLKKKQQKQAAAAAAPSSFNNLTQVTKKENNSEDNVNPLFSSKNSDIDDEQPFGRKKLGSFFEKALKELRDANDPTYTASKEERGQDVPDEQLLGNLIGEEDSYDDEDKDSDDEYGMKFRHNKNTDSIQLNNKFITTIHKMRDKHVMLPGYSKLPKNTVNWTPYENVDLERKRDKWLLVKDKCRTMQIQNEIIVSMEEEDPTYGLDIAIRPLEFFSRVSARWKKCTIEFIKLD